MGKTDEEKAGFCAGFFFFFLERGEKRLFLNLVCLILLNAALSDLTD